MRISILFLLSMITLSAHPHSFVDVYPAIDEESITIRWEFDEMSSQMLIMDFDRDHDGSLSEKESGTLYKETFAGLKEFEYYTYFYHDGKKIATPESDSFMASIEEYKVNFYFTLPRPEGTTEIRFYDEEMFTAYLLKKAFIKMTDKSRSFELKKLDGDYFFGYILELR